MLNDLLEVRKSLERGGLQYSVFSTWLNAPAHGPGLLLLLDRHGGIAGIEYVANMAELWTIKKSNHETWPCMKLKAPFWEVKASEFKELKAQDQLIPRLDQIEQLCRKKNVSFTKRKKADLAVRLQRLPESIRPNLAAGDQEGRVLLALIGRGELLLKDLDTLPRRLLERFLEQARQGSFSLSEVGVVETLLFGSWDSKKEETKATDVPCAFELADYPALGLRVTDPSVGRWLAGQLPLEQQKTYEGTCALSGRQGRCTTKFPQPTLPIIGPTYLMSMNEDAPCHDRYGLIGSRICPVSESLAGRLSNMLQYLTSAEKKGVTWQAIPSSKPKAQDLLVAYLADKPEYAGSLAACLCGINEQEMGKAIYEEHTARFCESLRSFFGNLLNESLIRILILSNVDSGHQQVVMSRTCTTEALVRSLHLWCEGAHNGPMIQIQLPKKGEKGSSADFGLAPPTPAQVMRLYQGQWIRGGADCGSVAGCRASELYEIFLDTTGQCRGLARQLLSRLLTLAAPLLAATGQALILRNTAFLSGISRGRRALEAASLACLLLDKLGSRKEQYMKGAAFNVGRFLNLVDRLHELYCKNVRGKDGKGGFPPQLIGNAHLAIALENPAGALARLAERLRVYQAWAATCGGECAGLARWVLAEMGRVSDTLAGQELPSRMSEAQKAELLLGYLARVGKGDEEAKPEEGVQDETAMADMTGITSR